MHASSNNEALSRNHSHRAKTISITYSECLSVALAAQHEKRMYRVTLSSVAGPTAPYFSTFSKKRHNFRKKKQSYWTQNVRFELFYKFCLKHFSS